MTARRQKNAGLRKICACPRRTWAKCPHPWHFSFKWKGVHHRFSLDKQLGRRIESKTKAETEAEKIRMAIRAGTFGAPTPREELTLQHVADLYLARMPHADRSRVGVVCATVVPRPSGEPQRLGDWRLADIVTDTVEQFREARRTVSSDAGTNRNLAQFRALLNWGVKVGYLDTTPFRRGGAPVVKLAREAPRSRRLNADLDEERALLAACGPHLRAVVECALETGMRRGEILSLQWKQIEGLTIETGDDGAATLTWAKRSELVLPWAKTKTRRDRRIPISSRLRPILEMRRFDPAGAPLPVTAFVFGTEIGQRVASVKRAWMTAVLKAHGQTPAYTATANLAAQCRAALDAIDLHFHDLRREAGSRWLEGGVPLHTIRDWLGHTSIAQTSTYLGTTMKTQHDAMVAFDAKRSALDQKVSLQRIATGSQTGGRKSPSTATTRDGTPN
jgi:integrase